MSKSSTGANISAEDIIRMNPDLLGQVGQAPPQSIPEPMPEPATMTTDEAIANFYGSGDRITQPDMAYYDQFPLPGDTGRAPAPGSAQMTDMAAPQTMANSGAAGAMPSFQPMQTPAEVIAAMARLSGGGRGGRKNQMERRSAREVIDRFEEDPASFAPPAPVNLAGMNISTPMPTTAFQPQMMAQAPSPMPAPIVAPMPAPIAAPMERPAVMPSRGPMVPIFDFDFEDMERGMRFGR
jgi:hypothetical protein